MEIITIMKKIDLLYGCLMGFAASFIGCYIYILWQTEYTFLTGIQLLKSEGQLGKLITLGALLNLAVFFLLLKNKKELMAPGVILATLLLAIATIFV